MKRLVAITAGWTVLIIGIILIPYPGPGWLIVFTGLAILSAEYTWANRALHHTRGKYDRWNDWIVKQHIIIRITTFVGTTLVVMVTLWIMNTYGLINSWLDLGQSWLRSPLL